ncbi:MAG: hypothetical protein QXT28_12410 [Thermofilaceae archaeon]
MASSVLGKILELKLRIESSSPLTNFTGKLSKTIVLSEAPHLEYLFKPIKGFFKPLRISPPLREKRAVTPVYTGRAGELKPVELSGEYTIEVGSPREIADELRASFEKAVGERTRVKFENVFVKYVVEDVRVVEPHIRVTKKAVVSTLSPALLPHPLVRSQHIRRFTVSPSTLLWVPFSIASGVYTHDERESIRIIAELERCLAEHYATRQKSVFINYDGNREPALEARAIYLLLDAGCRELVEKVLYAARIFGIGSSRASGFGSVDVKTL